MAIQGDAYLATNEMLTVAPAGAIGDKTLTIVTTLFIGGGGAGVVLKDELKGGYVEIFPVAGGAFMWRKITGNSANVGDNTIITVDRPFNVAVGVGSQVGLHPSIYRAIVPPGSIAAGYGVATGVPPVPIPLATPFFWLQTYGPVWLASTGAQPLSAGYDVDAYMHQDGTIGTSLGETIGTVQPSPQRIGHVMGAALYGCNQIFLELDNS